MRKPIHVDQNAYGYVGAKTKRYRTINPYPDKILNIYCGLEEEDSFEVGLVSTGNRKYLDTRLYVLSLIIHPVELLDLSSRDLNPLHGIDCIWDDTIPLNDESFCWCSDLVYGDHELIIQAPSPTERQACSQLTKSKGAQPLIVSQSSNPHS